METFDVLILTYPLAARVIKRNFFKTLFTMMHQNGLYKWRLDRQDNERKNDIIQFWGWNVVICNYVWFYSKKLQFPETAESFCSNLSSSWHKLWHIGLPPRWVDEVRHKNFLEKKIVKFLFCCWHQVSKEKTSEMSALNARTTQTSFHFFL